MNDAIPITLAYAGQLTAETGISEERLSISSGTALVTLLRQVGEKHGGKFREMLFDEEAQLRRGLIISVDGSHIVDPTDYVCARACEIFLMTPIAGG